MTLSSLLVSLTLASSGPADTAEITVPANATEARLATDALVQPFGTTAPQLQAALIAAEVAEVEAALAMPTWRSKLATWSRG